MKQTVKINLSKRVAEKYGIYAYVFWLHEDSARCFELAVENDVFIEFDNDAVITHKYGTSDIDTIEWYKYHQNKYEATRIAILRCLDKMKG